MSDYMFWVDYEVDNELNINHRSRFYITGDMLEDDMSDDDLKEMCLDMIQEDFEELMQPVYDETDDFVAWARNVINNRSEDK